MDAPDSSVNNKDAVDRKAACYCTADISNDYAPRATAGPVSTGPSAAAAVAAAVVAAAVDAAVAVVAASVAAADVVASTAVMPHTQSRDLHFHYRRHRHRLHSLHHLHSLHLLHHHPHHHPHRRHYLLLSYRPSFPPLHSNRGRGHEGGKEGRSTSFKVRGEDCTSSSNGANKTFYCKEILLKELNGEGRWFDTWLDDLQLYLLSDSRDSVSLFNHTSRATPAPPATADSATHSQWLTRDTPARLAVRNHLPLTECAHFPQHRTTQALYDAVVARYSSPTTAALGRLLLPYLFPELSIFATVEDLVSHLCTSNARYHTTLSAEFLDRNPPPMNIALYFIVIPFPASLHPVKDHFIALDPTSLTVDLLEQHLLAAETSEVGVCAADFQELKEEFILKNQSLGFKNQVISKLSKRFRDPSWLGTVWHCSTSLYLGSWEPLGAASTMDGPEKRGGRGADGSGDAQAQGQPRDSAMAPVQPSLGPPRDEPRVFGLDKFKFAEWSFKMENIFDHYDLLEVMEGTEKRPENDPEKSPWVRKSAQGYLLLGQALGSSQIRHIKPFQREPEKGAKAWAALKGVHAPAAAAVAVVLERQMAAQRIEEDEAVEEGVHKFFDLLTRLEGADLNYSELQKKTKLLALLPESWSSLIINLNRDLPRLSLEDVKRAILQEDFRRRELRGADGAGAASIGREYGRGRGTGRGGGSFGGSNFNGGRGSSGYGNDNKNNGRGRGRSGLEHVELPLELSSGSTTTRQSSLVNGGEEAKDAEEEEEEVQQVSERAPTLPSRTTSAPRIRVTPQQRQGHHVPAAEEESIEENGTWELVELPEGRKGITSKWLFKIKSDANGKIERFKSRLVAKGYQQKEKVDCKEFFAPVVKPTTLRTLLAGAAIKGWVVKQMDVTTAFLNGVLEEEIFMAQPEGSLMVVYVDDILIFSPSSDLVKEVMLKLHDKFKCRALDDVNFYLWLHIERDVEKWCMRVHQRKYLEALAAKFGQSEGHVATPFPSLFKCVKGPEEESVGKEERRRFHSMVGSLMYAAVNTRPDVAFATGQLARVVQYPNEKKVASRMRVAKYLGQTPTVGLQYSAAAQRRQKGADGVEPGRFFLTAFSDASYASEPEDMTSVGGFICCVCGGPTAWESKKQVDQALSSVESEYMALFRAVREIVWQRCLLAELGEEQQGPTPLYCDSKVVIALAKNPVLHGLTKHMRVKWHWTRSMMAAGEVELHYVKMTRQQANMMTKRLVEQQHWKCCKLAGMALNRESKILRPTIRGGVCWCNPTVCIRLVVRARACVCAWNVSRLFVVGDSVALFHITLPQLLGNPSVLSIFHFRHIQAYCDYNINGGGGGSGGGGGGGSGGGSGGFGGGGGGSGRGGGSGGCGSGGGRAGATPQGGGSPSFPFVIRTGDRTSQTCGKPHTQHRCFSRLNDAWRAEFGDEAERPRWAELLRSGVSIFDLHNDAILAAMYALFVSCEGDCYLCVPPDPGIKVAALSASESALPGTVPAQALHTFTLDLGASRCFFRDSTTLTPLSAPVPVRLADPSRGPVVARSSTVLPCLAVPSSSLSGLHLPSFSTNLVNTAALKDAMVTTTTPGGQRVLICTGRRTARHLATFTRRLGSSLYTLASKPPQVAALPTCPRQVRSHPLAHVASCRTSCGTTALVTPPCHAFVACTLASLSLVFPGPCLPSRSSSTLRHGTHAMALRPSSVPLHVPLPAPPESSLPAIPDLEFDLVRAASPGVSRLLATVATDPAFESTAASALVAELSESASPRSIGGECALDMDVPEDRHEDFECLAAAVPHLVAALLAVEGDPDAPEIPTLRSYPEAITVYSLRQVPCEWHDTLRTTLAALRFTPSTADPSQFLRTDTSLPPFYVLIYVDDLVFAIVDTEALTWVNFAAILARYVAPVRRAWGSCLEDGVKLSSLVTETLLGSSCEAEIYTGAMAAQELRWLTYLLTDLGEQPCSPPVLYVDNKAMIALCQGHRLEHRTKHIALRYFLARELQQRGQLHLAYVATRANTTDIFTKAL
ncbi:unnamed protein product [Closterium sp. NIES-53]